MFQDENAENVLTDAEYNLLRKELKLKIGIKEEIVGGVENNLLTLPEQKRKFEHGDDTVDSVNKKLKSDLIVETTAVETIVQRSLNETGQIDTVEATTATDDPPSVTTVSENENNAPVETAQPDIYLEQHVKLEESDDLKNKNIKKEIPKE